MNKLEDLKILIEQLEFEMTKFYDKGNNAASIRARKLLQSIKAQAQIIREDISDTRNNKK